tara:strand:- start:2008 stop:3492 length:1485 start_codon:yes stop_codon:yes gene_type:complete
MGFMDTVKRLLMKGSQDNARQILRELQDQAEKWKPAGYDMEMLRRRDYYEGKQAQWLMPALRKRYPNTAADMSIITLNYAKLIADVDAAVYDHRPERQLLNDNIPLEPDDPQAKEYARITEQAAMNVVLAESERRLMLMDTIFLHVRYDFHKQAPVLEVFYPQDINIIPDPNNPTSFDDILCLIARVVGPDGVNDSSSHFVVYYRDFQDDHDGQGVKGPWKAERFSTDGTTQQIYPDHIVPFGVLPFVVWRNGIADGTIFRDADNDLLDALDAISVNLTNLTFVLDMQAHSMLAYEGDSREDIVGGPAKVISIAPNERLSVLDFNPKLKEMEQVNNNLIKTLASTRRQSPDAYSIDQRAPESGVARQIANMPYMKALKERQFYAQQMEQALYPIFCTINNAYGDGPTIDHERWGFRWIAGNEPDFTDPAQETTRVMVALDQGLISKERAAFELGFYESEEDARLAMFKTTEDAITGIASVEDSIAERLRLATGS